MQKPQFHAIVRDELLWKAFKQCCKDKRLVNRIAIEEAIADWLKKETK